MVPRKVLVAIGISITLPTWFMGCTGPEGPTGPPGPSVCFVHGFVRGPTVWTSSSLAYVTVMNTPTIPSVELNDIPVTFLGIGLSPAFEFLDFDFPISPGDPAILRVSYVKDDGSPAAAHANIRLPGEFEIVSHDTSEVVSVPVGSGLTIQWSSSDGADVYWVLLESWYDYIDTTGNRQEYSCTVDTVVTDTSMTFLSSRIFPNADEIDEVTDSGGWIDLYGVSGPFEEGDKGNVVGDGIGFFCGVTFGGSIALAVEGSSYSAMDEREFEVRLREFVSDKVQELLTR